jgi:hypothetical protein
MTLGRIACALTVVAVVCVLTVFFFHAIAGPYSVVHGPVTALLSVQAAARLRMTIMRAGVSALAVWISFSLRLVSWAAAWPAEHEANPLPEIGSQILRC